jgi:hypothetical protein
VVEEGGGSARDQMVVGRRPRAAGPKIQRSSDPAIQRSGNPTMKNQPRSFLWLVGWCCRRGWRVGAGDVGTWGDKRDSE